MTAPPELVAYCDVPRRREMLVPETFLEFAQVGALGNAIDAHKTDEQRAAERLDRERSAAALQERRDDEARELVDGMLERWPGADRGALLAAFTEDVFDVVAVNEFEDQFDEAASFTSYIFGEKNVNSGVGARDVLETAKATGTRDLRHAIEIATLAHRVASSAASVKPRRCGVMRRPTSRRSPRSRRTRSTQRARSPGRRSSSGDDPPPRRLASRRGHA